MANTVIQLKSSGTPSSMPGSLANGEIALNYADGKFYYKNVTGQIVSFAGSGNVYSFATINANNSLVTALSNNSVLTITPGQNIGITADIINDIITISANLKPAFDVTNSAYSIANAAFGHSNTTYTAVNSAFGVINAAFDKANTFSAVNVGNTVPASPIVGSLWWDTDSGRMFIYYTDADSSQWVEASPSGGAVNVSQLLANTSGTVFNGNLNISTDLWIGNNITNVTSLIFNTSTNRTPSTPGELTWSQDDSTLHFDTDTPGNVVLHIGQDQAYYVKNQSGQTIYKGNVCMFSGTLGASGRLKVQRAIANNAYPSKYVMGIAAADILNGNDGFVISQGKIRGIDTSMFAAGEILYLSATNPGQMSNTMPTAPNNKVTMAAVIYSDATNGSIEVRPTLGSKLNEDELAELNGLTNSDVLAYVSANSRFENSQILVSAFTKANNALANTNGVVFAGNLTVTGTVSATHFDNVSDINLKDNVEPLHDVEYIVSNLSPVSFNWRKDGSKSFGLIAQEVEAVLPEIVHILEDGTKTVSYMQIIPFLLSTIKKQQEDINNINKKLDKLTKSKK